VNEPMRINNRYGSFFLRLVVSNVIFLLSDFFLSEYSESESELNRYTDEQEPLYINTIKLIVEILYSVQESPKGALQLN